MDSPASVLARPNSKIFSTLQAMTRVTHRLPNHAATRLIASYPTLAAHATVCFLVHPPSLVMRSICSRMDRYLSLHFPLPCAVNSIILLTNGISFAVQAILLLSVGAWADYGTWRYASTKTFQGAVENVDCSTTGRTS
jgi:MFS-type transporter involved in bile tolerance (Atg22 family)